MPGRLELAARGEALVTGGKICEKGTKLSTGGKDERDSEPAVEPGLNEVEAKIGTAVVEVTL